MTVGITDDFQKQLRAAFFGQMVRDEVVIVAGKGLVLSEPFRHTENGIDATIIHDGIAEHYARPDGMVVLTYPDVIPRPVQRGDNWHIEQ